MKTITKSMLALGLLSLSTAIFADSTQSFDYNNKTSTNYVDNTTGGSGTFDDMGSKLFFGGSIGPSDAGDYCAGSTGCEDKDTAWKIFGGYKLTERLSAEAAYVNLGNIHKTTGGTVQVSDTSAVTVSGVAALPINDQIDVFGKAGVMRWSSSNTAGSESGFAITYGVGAKMALSEKTKLRAEWEKLPGIETAPGSKTDINMLSVGVELSTF